jgi:hypothetical protein
VGIAVHGPADRDAFMLAPRQIGDRRIHSDADVSEAHHIDENFLLLLALNFLLLLALNFLLLLALDVDEGKAVLGRFAFGWSRFGSVSAAGRHIGPVDPFGFSWPLVVSLRDPRHDFGFSRISLDSLIRIETFQ